MDDQKQQMETKVRTTVVAYVMITIGLTLGVGLVLLKFFQP